MSLLDGISSNKASTGSKTSPASTGLLGGIELNKPSTDFVYTGPEAETPADPVIAATPEEKGILSIAKNAGKSVLDGVFSMTKAIARFQMDQMNAMVTGPKKTIDAVGDILSETKPFKEAGEGFELMNQGKVQGTKSMYITQELLPALADPAVSFLNLDRSQKAIKTIGASTSNIPLKLISAMQATGQQTYDQAYAAWLVERNDPTNKTWEKFIYEVQDALPQSAIGVALSLSTTALTRNPIAGYTVSGAYYTALSANEQIENNGKVYSLGNIGIDVVGDQVLSALAMNIVKVPAGQLVKEISLATGIEGTTEVAQSLAKYSNDYANAKTEEEKQRIISELTNYIKNGGMAMEFAVGAVSGGVITGVAGIGGQISNPSVQPQDATTKRAPMTEALKISAPKDIEKIRDAVANGAGDPESANDPEFVRAADLMTTYAQTFSERTLYIPSTDSDSPMVSVSVLPFPDGKFAVSFEANTASNGISGVADFSTLHKSPEDATAKAIEEISAWAKTQIDRVADAKERAQYQNVINALKNPDAGVSPSKAQNAPTAQEAEKMVKDMNRGVNERGTAEMTRKALSGELEGSRLDLPENLQRAKDYAGNNISVDATPETMVRVYRAGPIEEASYVTTIEKNAQKYATQGREPVTFKDVPAKDLVHGGGLGSEFIYAPKKPSAKKSLKEKRDEKKAEETHLEKAKESLRKAKGLSADDIMKTYPDIELKRDVPVTDIHGKKSVIPEGEALTPYELKGNKVLLQDGETYIVSKNQFANIKGNATTGEAKEFAPEMKDTEETIMGSKSGKLGEVVSGKDIIGSRPPKYSSYTLPGGENYKEILVKATPESRADISFKEFVKQYDKRFPDAQVSEADKRMFYNNGMTVPEEGKFKSTNNKIGVFTSTHWSEPNVIFHLRMNERMYEGKRVSFLEELQSDWAREGRKTGFKMQTENPESLLPYGWKVTSNGDTWKVVDESGNEVPSKIGTGIAYGGSKNVALGKALGDETLMGDFKGGIPNHPLLKKWEIIAVKRALKEAVDTNAEYFAWINGEQTSARYNLATHLENVSWKKANKIGGIGYDKQVVLNPKGDTGSLVVNLSKDGEITGVSGGASSEWKGKKLDEVVGKGLADKIMEKESGTLSGEGLKFGGEWANNLYDKQVGVIVRDLTGAKIETLDMGLSIKNDPTKFIIQGGRDAGGTLTQNSLKVGLEINIDVPNGATDYVVTDVFKDGKFNAVPKNKVFSKATYLSKDLGYNELNENKVYKKTDVEKFDLSSKTTTQQGIRLTDEVKRIIRGEAPEIKKPSGKIPFASIPDRSRTDIAQVESVESNPLTYGDKKNVSKPAKKVKQAVVSNQERDQYYAQLYDVYNATGQSNVDGFTKADEELNGLLMEIDLAEAGQRSGFTNYAGPGLPVYVNTSTNSTFPKWIDEDLRSKELFDKVFSGIERTSDLKYPSRPNATKQRIAFNAMLDQLDVQLGIDTKDIRSNIMKTYGKNESTNKAGLEAQDQRGTASGEGVSGRTEVAKKESVQEKGVTVNSSQDLGFNPLNITDPMGKRLKEEKEKIVQRQAIARDLATALGTSIRMGKFSGSAVGIFKQLHEGIRLKSKFGGLPTIFHESGHFIDKKLNISGKIPEAEVNMLMKEYGVSYKGQPSKRQKEAFAELVRYYMTGQEERVKNEAPVALAQFMQSMNRNPEIFAAIEKARTDYARWKEMPAAQQVFSHLEMEVRKPALRDRLSMFWHDLYTNAIDDLHPIEQFAQIANERESITAQKDPYKLARLMRGWTGRAESFLTQGTFGKKFWKEENGKIVPNYTGKSLQEILKPIDKAGEMNDFRSYLLARRAIELHGRKDADGKPAPIVSGINDRIAREALKELNEKYPHFEQAANDFTQYLDHVMTYAVEKGLISKKSQKAMRELNRYYVPFYRAMITDEGEAKPRKFLGKRLGNAGQGVKKIKGSDLPIVDPIESAIKNTYMFINLADRNEVGVAMANLASNNPELARLFEKVDRPMEVSSINVAQGLEQKFGKFIYNQFPVDLQIFLDGVGDIMKFTQSPVSNRPNDITVYIDGTPTVFHADAEIFKSMQGLNTEDVGMVMRILSTPASFLRAGATLTPEFVLRNPLRDQFSAWAYSQGGFIPGVDMMKGAWSIISDQQSYELWKMSGGEMATLVSIDRKELQMKLEDLMKSRAGRLIKFAKNPIEIMRMTSAFTEEATRLGEMQRVLAKTKDPLQAGFASREITLDFNRVGAKTRAVNNIVAFWNANVQGTDKMIRSLRRYPFQTLLKIFLGITLPSILLWLASHDDPRYQEIPDWQKNLFWIVMPTHISRTKWDAMSPTEKAKFSEEHPIWRIPKPFELGIVFGSAVERTLDVAVQKKDGAYNDLMLAIGQGATPGIIPTAMLPVIENISNYSFFLDRPIVPSGKTDLPSAQQYSTYTSESAKLLGEKLNVSPAKLDNLIQGYFGGLGKYATNATDKILKGSGITNPVIPPKPSLADMAAVRAFVVRSPMGSGSQSVNTFYNLYAESTQGSTYVKQLIKQERVDEAKAYLAEHPEILRAKELSAIAKTFSEIRKASDMVYRSKTLTPEEKRTKIGALDALMTDIAYKALNITPQYAEN